MHQKWLFGDQKSKKISGEGALGLSQTLSLPPKLAVSSIDADCKCNCEFFQGLFEVQTVSGGVQRRLM